MDLYVTTVSFVGSRDVNEDNFLVDNKYEIAKRSNVCIGKAEKIKLKKKRLFAVSDGMGGLSNGDTASLTVIKGLYKYRKNLSADSSCWDKINKSLISFIRKKGAGCGATLSACELKKSADGIIAHTYTIGDSPVYIYSGEDDEVRLVNVLDNSAGLSDEEMTEEERKKAKCVLHHFFGREYDKNCIPIHENEFEVKKGDVIVVASDGITTIDEAKICEIIDSPKYTNLALALATSAIENSDEYCDNTTVIAIEVM